MLEISILLRENGTKKPLGHLISEAADDLKKRYKPFEVALRLVKFKRDHDALILKYDIAGDATLLGE